MLLGAPAGESSGELTYSGQKSVDAIRAWLLEHRDMWRDERASEGAERRAEAAGGSGITTAGAVEHGEWAGDAAAEWVTPQAPALLPSNPNVASASDVLNTVLAAARESLVQTVHDALPALAEEAATRLDEQGILQLMQGDSADDDSIEAAAAASSEDFLSPRPSMSTADKMRRSLLNWLLVLQHGLPREFDQGAAAEAVSKVRHWLLAEVIGVPTQREWMHTVEHAGIARWGQVTPGCVSTNDYQRRSCALWVLFHTLSSHVTDERAVASVHAIAAYAETFHRVPNAEGEKSVGHCDSADCQFSAALWVKVQARQLDPRKEGARDQAMLWLWQAHNEMSMHLETLLGRWSASSSCLLDVSENGGSRDLQLSEVRLFGQNRHALSIHNATVFNDGTNTHCRSPKAEAPWQAVDGSAETKWLCHAPTAMLHLVLTAPAVIAGYELVTANDFEDRDPKDWTLKCREGMLREFME